MNQNYFEEEKNFLPAFQRGEEEAFKQVYKKFFQALCVYCNRIVRDEAASCDLVQDTFLKLWESRKNFSALLAIKAFLYMAVKNAALNYLKHQKFTDNDLTIINETMLINPEIEAVIKAEAERQILALLEDLPVECRKVMKYLNAGKSYKEIAEILHISVNTVKNHRIRGLKILRKKSQNLYVFLYFLFL